MDEQSSVTSKNWKLFHCLTFWEGSCIIISTTKICSCRVMLCSAIRIRTRDDIFKHMAKVFANNTLHAPEVRTIIASMWIRHSGSQDGKHTRHFHGLLYKEQTTSIDSRASGVSVMVMKPVPASSRYEIFFLCCSHIHSSKALRHGCPWWSAASRYCRPRNTHCLSPIVEALVRSSGAKWGLLGGDMFLFVELWSFPSTPNPCLRLP